MKHSHLELTDIEFLVNGAGDVSRANSIELSGAQEHLEECQDCSTLVTTYQLLKHQAPPAVGDTSKTCPPQEVWWEVATVVMPIGRPSGLIEHAASCAKCGALLAEAREDLDSSTIEEEVEQLLSSNESWQQGLARRLVIDAAPASQAALHIIRKRRFNPIMYGAIAACLIAAILLGVYRYLNVRDGVLLARSYNKRRMTELRLYGGGPGPVASTVRGSGSESIPVDLLKVKLRAEEHLERNPNDAYWQQVLGRVALVDGDGEQALEKLQVAKVIAPDLPGLDFDLASAQFEVGRLTELRGGNGSEFYVTAADLFEKVLDNPEEATRKPFANFNLALIMERRALYCQALKNYQDALAEENDESWRTDIANRIKEVKPNCDKTGDSGLVRLDRSPDAFLATNHSDARKADALYEIYLDIASREWVAKRFSDPRTLVALEELAAVGARHQDFWLHDLLRAPPTTAERRASALLQEGLTASARGDGDNALVALTQASSLYRTNNNQSGYLRARVEVVYTMQRLGRSADCLRAAPQFHKGSVLDQQPWLRAYLILEVAICRAALGDSVAYKQGIRDALALSSEHAFHLQVLREQGLLVECLNALGQRDAAWTVATSALRDCATTVCPPSRAYQLLQSLHTVTEEKGFRWDSADLADAAAQMSSRLSNIQLQAYAQEVLGNAQVSAGHVNMARQAFAHASYLMKSVPAGPAVSLYKADWEADRSSLLERDGQLNAGLKRLKNIEPQIEATDNYLIRQRYYTQLASMLLHAQNASDALRAATLAVNDAEVSLSSTVNVAQRLTWEQANARGYRLLVESLIEMNKPQEALEAWEWYKSAPYRKPSRSLSIPIGPDGVPHFLSVHTHRQPSTTLVVAKLEDFYVSWLIREQDDQVRFTKARLPANRIDEMAHVLGELCSNPESKEVDIKLLGAKLYEGLLSPFNREIELSSVIYLDVDTRLQRLPFTVLIGPDSRYLNDTHALTYLAAWWTTRPPVSSTISSEYSALVVEGSPIADRASSAIPAEYLETKDVAAIFRRSRILRSQQVEANTLGTLLPQTQVFHFNGHTLTFNGETGLLLRYPNTLLTPNSLDGLSLQGCRLAVLATCSSAGRSDRGIEDATSMAHAMLVAGVSNVVASLWDMDSQASRRLMITFYRSIAESVPVTVALQLGQQRLRADPETRHPFFWAPLQVYSQ